MNDEGSELRERGDAYEAGVYMGTDQEGLPLPGTGPGLPPQVLNEGNTLFDGTAANAFRFAINPPMRKADFL